ncbi:stAR-related lipid transfer protein 3-like isoform X2 [Lycorma delicatula]|uniref:stAR-related lipid transfer protein 3-like isoform X2 n=1 Tax=Lycorma delicatula TaxID=130591 RepID=UPI003F513FC6
MDSMSQYGSVLSHPKVSLNCARGPKSQQRFYVFVKELFTKSYIHAAYVRKRQLTLLTIFGVVFNLFLWLMYNMAGGEKNLHAIIVSEIFNYRYETSLFDLVACQCLRCTILWFYINVKPERFGILVFIGTIITTAFVFHKSLFVDWSDSKHANSGVGLATSCLLFSWLELLLFDVRIFQYVRRTSGRYSDMEGENACSQVHALNAEDLALIKKGQEVMIEALETLFTEGWTKRSPKDSEDVIESKSIDGVTIWRMQITLDLSTEGLMTLLYDDFENQKEWNTSVIESKVIKTLDTHTDIAYTVSTKRGPVKSRDFVVLRHRAAVGTSFVIASVSIETPLVPEDKQYVRAENGPGCFVISPLLGHGSNCELRWLINTDIKGWIPQRIIDAAFTSCIDTYILDVRKVVKQIKELPRSSMKLLHKIPSMDTNVIPVSSSILLRQPETESSQHSPSSSEHSDSRSSSVSNKKNSSDRKKKISK